MPKKRVIAIISVLLMLVLGAWWLLGKNGNLFSGNGGQQDTLIAVEKLTPEIEALSLEIRNKPKDAALFYARANAYYDYGNLKYALADYRQAFTLDSNSAVHALGYSDCLFDMNQVDSSITILESFEKRVPGNADILLNLAVNYFLLPQPKYELAIDRLNDLLKTDIQNAHAYFYKGLIYKEAGNREKAISSFQTCTEVDPDYYDAWMQLGLLHAEQGDPLAIKYYDNAIAVGDSSREAEYAKAKFLQDEGDIAEAIEYYRKMVVKDPQDADALYNLATIYYGIDSIQKAYRYFDMTIKQSPAKAYAHYGKGLCADKLGKKQEALAYYEQAITLGVSDEDIPEIEKLIAAIKAP